MPLCLNMFVHGALWWTNVHPGCIQTLSVPWIGSIVIRIKCLLKMNEWMNNKWQNYSSYHFHYVCINVGLITVSDITSLYNIIVLTTFMFLLISVILIAVQDVPTNLCFLTQYFPPKTKQSKNSKIKTYSASFVKQYSILQLFLLNHHSFALICVLSL